ncbi:hypothetical protein FisN_24Lh220 [Fistulifera solaris]|uniref:Uncharacterized protein n=1 Tax=Fistulifera solaris TaxID=1519565 RepID=A0A1Z5K9Z4_FISSO|nr:hypothetical protein FisN_24Lh220 [Fistulifera solaris]|eukprot:GAX22931.1 hypothetical protein FisN_24Lh220 [Fistulifera solaris]
MKEPGEDELTLESNRNTMPQSSAVTGEPGNGDATGRDSSRYFSLKTHGSFDEDHSVGNKSPDSSDEDISIFRTRSLLDDDDGEEAEGETGPDATLQAATNLAGNKESSIRGISNKPQQLVHAPQGSMSAESRQLTCRPSVLSVHLANQHSWDGFVRRGTRLKTFVDGAMHKLRDSFGAESGEKRQQPSGQENSVSEPPQQRRRLDQTDFASSLAQERTAEVIHLQRQLKDYEVQASAMKAANDALREESASIQQRLDRTTQALRAAGSNAQKARADADAAQATAASLAQTLDSLDTVVTETKRASQVLHQEHQKISSTVSLMEGKLIQKESELIRVNKELKSLRAENTELEELKTKWSDEQKRLKKSLDLQDEELRDLKQLQGERDALEKARKIRAEQVEKELRETQEMLISATSGQAQAEKIQKELQETILELRKSNEDIHAKMSLQQSTNADEVSRLSEALTKAEKETQKLRIEAEAAAETIQRLKMERESAKKQISDLKSRALAAEHRVKDLSSMSSLFTTPEAHTNQKDARTVSTTSTTPAASKSFILPPLNGSGPHPIPTSTDKENTIGLSNVPQSSICSICSKASYGLMKPCQCGNKACTKKAHLSCVNRIQPGPSVSHPGTPAPQLPVVLCSVISSGN